MVPVPLPRRAAWLLIAPAAALLAGCVAPDPALPGEPCSPTGVVVVAGAGPVNVLSWDADPLAVAYIVWRGLATGDITFLASVAPPATTYEDADVTAGTAYRYRVNTLPDEGETLPCGTAETTAIPALPGLLAAALALGGGAAGYRWASRRRGR